MAWTSIYNATFTKPLVRQLLAIVQRDQRAALDYVAGISYPNPGALASLVSYQLAPLALPQFPAVLIAPMDSSFDRDAVGSLHSVNRLYVAVAVAHQNPQVLAEMVQDYVRAVDAILQGLAADLSQLYSGWPLSLPQLSPGGSGSLTGPITTAPLADGTVKDLFISQHAYDEIRRVKNDFAMVATLTVIVDREET